VSRRPSELAQTIQDVTGAREGVRFEPKRAGEVYKSSVDISKIRRVLGFDPAVQLADGLARTADWYRATWTPSPP
jgi:nucleoside-diphosphate-sugar epimerase